MAEGMLMDYGGEQDPSGNQGPSGNQETATPGTKDNVTSGGGMVSPSTGNMIGQATTAALGLAGVSTGLSGFNSAVGGVVGGVASGKAPESIGIDAATTVGKATAGQLMGAAGMPTAGIGYAVNTLGTLASEMQKTNPNFGYALTANMPGAFAATIGGMLLGPAGALIGGALGSHFGAVSFSSGALGDAVDSRSHESMRDNLETAYATAGIGYFDALGYSDNVANDPGAGIGDMANASAGQMGIGNPGSYGSVTTYGDMYGDSGGSAGDFGGDAPGSQGTGADMGNTGEMGDTGIA